MSASQPAMRGFWEQIRDDRWHLWIIAIARISAGAEPGAEVAALKVITPGSRMRIVVVRATTIDGDVVQADRTVLHG